MLSRQWSGRAPRLRRVAGLLVGMLLSVPAYCTGIPTVDVGLIAQQTLAYQQQLRAYETQLRQVGLGTRQLTMLNRQFSQTLREYNDYLQQVRGLQHVISRRDWNSLFQTLRRHYGVSAYARVATEQQTGKAGRTAIDQQVRALYAVPEQVEKVRRQVDAAGLDAAPWVTQAQRQWARYEAYRDQLEFARDSSRELSERHHRVGQTKQNFDLGDKSDLNALHTAVTSNFHVIDELQALNKIQNQHLLHANHEFMQALSGIEAARQAELSRAQRLLEQPASSGSLSWGALETGM